MLISCIKIWILIIILSLLNYKYYPHLFSQYYHSLYKGRWRDWLLQGGICQKVPPKIATFFHFFTSCILYRFPFKKCDFSIKNKCSCPPWDRVKKIAYISLEKPIPPHTYIVKTIRFTLTYSNVHHISRACIYLSWCYFLRWCF